MRKLRAKKGETLVETLIALLVATLVLLFLSTAIVSAVKVNEKIRDIDTSFSYVGATSGDTITVTIKDESNQQKGSKNATLYTDATEQYQYYEAVTSNG